mgnify:CR=1 FL=1
MKKEYPLVSVITPTYKRPDSLPRAIDSVLNQSYPNVEIIVVDDNNPGTEGRQKTEIIMASYANNPRVKYIKHDINKNGAAARNTGVRNSKARYVGFLDDDDEFLPQKIESQVNLLEHLSEEWGVCYSKAFTKKTNSSYILRGENRQGYLFLESLTRNLGLLAGSNLLLRRSAFESINGFDETFRRNQDVEFTTRLLQKYKIAYCDTPGLIVYIHNEHKYYKALDVDKQYCEQFANLVNSLDEKDRQFFFKELSKQMFFSALRSDKNYNYCLNAIIKHLIPYRETLIYIYRRMKKSIKPPVTYPDIESILKDN